MIRNLAYVVFLVCYLKILLSETAKKIKVFL